MTASILELSRFAARGPAAVMAADRAIARFELLRLIRDRRAELGRIRTRQDGERELLVRWQPLSPAEARRRRDHLVRLDQRHQAELTDAQLRLGMVEAGLAELEEGRALA